MKKVKEQSTVGREIGISEIEPAILDRLTQESCLVWRPSHELLRKKAKVHQCFEVRHDLGTHAVSLSTEPWPWRAIDTVKLAEGSTGEMGQPEEGRANVEMQIVWISVVSPWDFEEFSRSGRTSPKVLEAVIHPKSGVGDYERRFYGGFNVVRLIDRAADDKVMFESQGKGFEFIEIRPMETQSEYERFGQDLAGIRLRWSVGSGCGKASGRNPVGERKEQALRSLWSDLSAREVAVAACALIEDYRDRNPQAVDASRFCIDLAISGIVECAGTVWQAPLSLKGDGTREQVDDGGFVPADTHEIVKRVSDTIVKVERGMGDQPKRGVCKLALLAMRSLLQRDVSVGVPTYWNVQLVPAREWPGAESPLPMCCASMAVRRADGVGGWQIRQYFGQNILAATNRMLLDVISLGGAGMRVACLGVYKASVDTVRKVSALVEASLKEPAGSAAGATAERGPDTQPRPETEYATGQVVTVAEKS